MKSQNEENQIKPKQIIGEIRLPNKKIKVEQNAVGNSGKQSDILKIVRELKKASREGLFPPVVASS